MSKEKKLREIVEKFVKDQRISCEECIYQSDRVIENAYDFMAEIVSIVGYYEYPEDD